VDARAVLKRRAAIDADHDGIGEGIDEEYRFGGICHGRERMTGPERP
jgi:hypothetical protein